MSAPVHGYASVMALTERRLHQLREEEVRPVHLGGGKRPSVSGWIARPNALPRWLPVSLALAWVAFLPLARALEPSAARAEAAPWWALLLEVAFITTLIVAAMGLARRQRMGLLASAGAAGVALTAAVMCPVSGHHVAVGAWWFAQMGGFLALGAASLAGLRASRARA